MSETRARTRRGCWTYGDHPGLNPGWRLGSSNMILDFDPLDRNGALTGAYILWIDGRPGPTIDHYLDDSMRYVETNQAAIRTAAEEAGNG